MLHPLGAIAANIDLLSTAENLFSEFIISFASPNFFKIGFLQITHTVSGILVEATGNCEAVPGDHAGIPHPETTAGELVLEFIGAIGRFPVAAVFIDGGNKWIAIFVIVDLRGFDLYLIHSKIFT